MRASVLALIIGVNLVASLQGDLRIRAKETGSNGTTIRVEYYKGTLWRTDPREGGGYRIIDSATRRVIIVDPVRREFWTHTYTPQKQTADPSRTIVVEIEGRDTGERRQMFGYPAHRFVMIQRRHTEYPDKPPSGIQEKVTDGWYLDVPFPLPKEYRGFAVYTAYVGNPQHPGLAPKIKVTRLGSMPNGLQVRQTGDSLMEVTEFSRAELDPKLFEPPDGYRGVIRRN